ncbi:hypothetical protein [Inconstantimicrobium porci]|uniref:ABC-2 type transporter domain-containing protein n=1 Tax=Inconstantimicrobium porci TaxID=2652291 RepID=A0A7X2T366_9CLOT|nr:hypothetical protein [Inconstantimicrobium porci]MSR92688.1 hypothetical protein [Inconstantimicrobium porci]
MFFEFLKKEYILNKRYLLNGMVGLIVITMLFLFIYLGLESVTSNFYSVNSNISLIISYISWVLSISAFQTVADSIIEESKEGTIQTLFFSRYSFEKLLLFKVLAASIFDIVFIYVIMMLCSLITHTVLSFNIIYTTIIFMISFLSYWGLGFILGGISLIFKKVDSISQVMTFVFMAVMLMPINNKWLFALPGVSGKYFLNVLLLKNYGALCMEDYIYLVIGNVIYFIIGIIFFRFTVRIAVKKGTIGQI